MSRNSPCSILRFTCSFATIISSFLFPLFSPKRTISSFFGSKLIVIVVIFSTSFIYNLAVHPSIHSLLVPYNLFPTSSSSSSSSYPPPTWLYFVSFDSSYKYIMLPLLLTWMGWVNKIKFNRHIQWNPKNQKSKVNQPASDFISSLCQRCEWAAQTELLGAWFWILDSSVGTIPLKWVKKTKLKELNAIYDVVLYELGRRMKQKPTI